ncbi:MAG: hypothetical protein O7I93_17315 [Gemmatimonadetes bacterium]|nr:hypothetical protein [Gemmatimonadota bacterium]
MTCRRATVQLGFSKTRVAGLQGVCARGWCVGRAVGRLAVAAGLLVAASAGCGPRVAIIEVLQVNDVTTGWFDDGIVQGGLNRLVPTISFRLENTADVDIWSVQINGVFRRAGEEEEWGSTFVQVVGAEGLFSFLRRLLGRGSSVDGLASRAETPPIVLRSDLGYTGEEPRLEMFENRYFVDVKVELFVKHGGAQWVKLSEFPIERQLLTR